MRHLTAVAAALGLLLAASAPSFAATTIDHSAIELAAAKKKVDCTNPKNAKNKACAKSSKHSDLSVSLSAASKKKVDCTNPKNAKNKACAKKMDKQSSLSADLSAAAKKKIDCKNPKNAHNKACAKK